jgi:hypothetical protein
MLRYWQNPFQLRCCLAKEELTWTWFATLPPLYNCWVHPSGKWSVHIDYRSADGKEICELIDQHCAIREVLSSFLKTPQSWPLKNEPLSHKIHSKILQFCCRLKWPNSKSGCEVAVLHLLLNWRSISSCHSADERRRAFQPFIPFLIFVSLLEIERLYRIITPRAASKNRPSAHLLSLVHMGKISQRKNKNFIFCRWPRLDSLTVAFWRLLDWVPLAVWEATWNVTRYVKSSRQLRPHQL